MARTETLRQRVSSDASAALRVKVMFWDRQLKHYVYDKSRSVERRWTSRGLKGRTRSARYPDPTEIKSAPNRPSLGERRLHRDLIHTG